MWDADGLKVTVDFPSAIEPIQGYWYSDNAYLAINGVKVDGNPSKKDKGWSDHIAVRSVSESGSAVSPSFSATIPLSAKDMHQRLKVDAYMIVTYPSNNGNGTFSNLSEQLSNHYELFLVSAQDLVLRERINNLKSEFETNRHLWEQRTNYLVLGIIFVIIPLALGGAFIGHERHRASAKP